MKLIGLIVLFLSISFRTFSQEKEPVLESIQATIHNYFDGYIERDINKLNQAFDTENGTMKVPKMENGKVIGFKNAYFKDLMPIWGNREKLSKKVLENCALEIQNIDIIDGKMASAKISIKVDTVTYIDILSLQKINNLWKITNKTFVVE